MRVLLPLVLTLITLPVLAQDEDLERTVTLMAKIGFSTSPSFAPEGDRVAFVSNISGVPQVWTVPVNSGWPAKVTALEDPVGSVRWSPAGDRLAISVAPGGGMNAQVFLTRPDGRRTQRITAGGKTNNYLGPWSRDGKLLTFSSNRRTPETLDAYVHEIARGRSRLRVKNPGIGFITDVSPDGKFAVVSRMESRSDDNLYLVDLRKGKEQLLTPHTPPGAFDGGLFAADGRTVYISSNKNRDLRAFAAVRLDGEGTAGEIEVIADREDAELEEFDVTEDGATAALLWNVAGKSELAFVDLASGEVTDGPPLPAEVARGITFSKDGARLAMTISGAVRPADIWVLDRDGGELTQLTHSPHAGVDLQQLARPRLLRFRSHDGVEISGWLYEPRDRRGRAPVVLSFHGGPEGQERPAFRADYQALVAAGISVFAPNVRGSSGFGKAFVNMDNGPLRWNGVKDIKACTDYLIRERIADAKRLGIMGGSYGGYMVMAGLSEYPDLFAAGANLFGVVNFKTFFEETEPWMAAISKVEYGDPDTQADMLHELSPINKIDRVKAPTIVLHGANDTNVPVVEAEQVVDNLKARNVPVEYILFEDEGHGFRKTKNRIRSTVAIVQWFERYLD
jgi:dipeptidyl aminopeptidase/acylaminoacyl peptidase